MNWLDERMQTIIITVGIGASLGTLWRTVMRPETNARKFFVRAFVCLSVGVVVGVTIVRWMDFSADYGVGVGSVCGFLSEEILLFVQVRGRKLERGQIDTSLKGDGDE